MVSGARFSFPSLASLGSAFAPPSSVCFVSGAAGAAALPPAFATSSATSSPFSPRIATAWPSFTFVPAGTSCLSSTPLSNARNSIVALSVSTSARRSSTATGSPSFLCHVRRTPSSIVGDSFGMSRIFAITRLPA